MQEMHFKKWYLLESYLCIQHNLNTSFQKLRKKQHKYAIEKKPAGG